jgi:hypothetical protein
MPKIDTDQVAMILNQNELPQPTVERIMKDIQRQIEEEQQQKEAEKAQKKKRQFVILLSDPENELPGKDIVGWVIQIPEEESPLSAPERIQRAAYDFNASPRGRKLPVLSMGEAIESVGAKFFKEQEVAVKTKVPVLALRTDNKLPTD